MTRDIIHSFLKENNIDKYIINDDLSVDVYESVNIVNVDLIELPFKFRLVLGSFIIRYTKLKSLYNIPDYVGGNLLLYSNEIEDLSFFPKKVDGNVINISSNRIKVLENIPLDFKNSLIITNCNIEVIESIPPILSTLYCTGNNINDFSKLNSCLEISYLGYSLSLDIINTMPICDSLYCSYDNLDLYKVRLDLVKAISNVYIHDTNIKNIYNIRSRDSIIDLILSDDGVTKTS